MSFKQVVDTFMNMVWIIASERKERIAWNLIVKFK